jgi:acyl dehydratase
MLAFEDLAVGRQWSPGSVTVTGDEIRDFAGRYDPQPFHVDPGAAAERFGGLIASGWHTAALCMRPFVAHVLDEVAVVAAVVVDDLRWHRPVRPGDELDVAVEIVATEPWDERRGLVTFRVTATNADEELVHARNDLVLVERREPSGDRERAGVAGAHPGPPPVHEKRYHRESNPT